MAPGLHVQIQRGASFTQLIKEVRQALARMLGCKPVPDLEVELPPTKRNLSLQGARLGSEFPGAYVSLSGIPGSLVDVLVFGSASRRFVGCSSVGRTAASDVLTAAVAIGAARSIGGKIEDHEHYWCDRDEYEANELMAALEIPAEGHELSVDAAIDLVSKKQFKPPSYGGSG